MSDPTLIPVVTLLITVSTASERLVEIIKGFCPGLDAKIEDDQKKEGQRRAVLQLLAVASGIVTVLYAAPALVALEVFPSEKGTPFLALRTGDLVFFLFALGFLASGGSGLWNAALTYLLKVKDIKAEVAARSRQTDSPPDRK